MFGKFEVLASSLLEMLLQHLAQQDNVTHVYGVAAPVKPREVVVLEKMPASGPLVLAPLLLASAKP